MSESNYWSRMRGTRISRRTALRGTGLGIAGLAGAALVGCGGDDETPESTSTPGGGGGGTTTPAATSDPSAARQGGTYTTYTSTFQGADPHNSVYGGAIIVPVVYNYLVRQEVLRQDLGDNGQILDLAESIEISGDQQTWTFKLRPGVKIHPNNEGIEERDLNAQDVIASFDRIADPDNGANGFATFALFVDSYEAPDDNTVQIVTSRPFAWLLEGLGDNLQGAIVPQEWLDKGDAVKAGAVGAGPFWLESLVEGDKAIMKRNPNYYREGQPYLDEFRVLIMPDTATRITAFRDRQIDVYATENPEEARSLQADGIIHVEHGSTGYNSFWMRTDTPPYTDERVRRAINLSMNRDQYIAIIGRGQGQPMGPLAPVFEGYALTGDELTEVQPYDPQEAQSLFQAASVSEIQFAHPTSANMNDYVNILQQQLQQIGVSIRPTPLDSGTWVAGYFASQHEASFSFNQSYKTPHFALQWYRTGGVTGNNNYNTMHYTDEVDAAIDNAAAVFDVEERKEAYKEAQRTILASDPAFLNVFNVANNTLFYSDIQRTQPGPGALDGSLIHEWWIDA